MQLITGSNNIGQAFNIVNNNTKESFVNVTLSGNILKVQRFNGTEIDITLPVNSTQVLFGDGSIGQGGSSGIYNTFITSAFDYIYNNTTVSKTTQIFNLNDNPNVFDRIDIIVLNSTTQTLSVKTGTPSASPVVPATAVDETIVGAIYVTSGASSTVNNYRLIYSAFISQQTIIDITNANTIKELKNLQDVQISNASSGEVLTYNSGLGKWVNAQPIFTGDNTSATNGLSMNGLRVELGGSFYKDTELDGEGRYIWFKDFSDIYINANNYAEFIAPNVYIDGGEEILLTSFASTTSYIDISSPKIKIYNSAFPTFFIENNQFTLFPFAGVGDRTLGVDSTGKLKIVPSSGTSENTTAGNGLSMVGDKVVLGGTLEQDTLISDAGSNHVLSLYTKNFTTDDYQFEYKYQGDPDKSFKYDSYYTTFKYNTDNYQLFTKDYVTWYLDNSNSASATNYFFGEYGMNMNNLGSNSGYIYLNDNGLSMNLNGDSANYKANQIQIFDNANNFNVNLSSYGFYVNNTTSFNFWTDNYQLKWQNNNNNYFHANDNSLEYSNVNGHQLYLDSSQLYFKNNYFDFNFQNDNLIIEDKSSVKKGLQYAANYHPNYTNRSLVDKEYVDVAVNQALQGLHVKQSARVATTTNITLSGLQTIDGVTLVAGDRVLVKNQTLSQNNGIYLASSSGWTRTPDFDGVPNQNELLNSFIFVNEGTLNQDTGWVLTTNAPITIDTTPLTFTQFSAAGVIEAGAGLLKTGNTLSVETGNGIEIVGNAVSVNTNSSSGLTFQGTDLVINAQHVSTAATNSAVVKIADDTNSLFIDFSSYQSNVVVLSNTSNNVSGSIGYAGTSINLSGVTLKGEPRLHVNGILYKIGFNATPSNNLAFFSPDGTTVRTSVATIQNGDKIYWNPLFANSFDLDTSDSVELVYNTQL
jgi:hypothetical protein